GVGILAFTDDDHIVLIRRAKWVGEYPGFFDRPGGHPEPEKVPDIQENPQAKKTHASIANEIWNSPVDELVEEVGVSSDQIESPKLLGTVQNLSLPGRPSLEFLTSKQQGRYRIYLLMVQTFIAFKSEIDAGKKHRIHFVYFEISSQPFNYN
ncbi:Nucleoside diphosphate-linked moiety X motif 22, partial [Armadillidium nasatum]